MKFNSTSKTPRVKPKEDEKLFENIIDNLGKPKVSPKVRKETYNEELERIIWETSDSKMPKPKHMDNSSIIKKEDFGKRPKQFSNMDPTSHPR